MSRNSNCFYEFGQFRLDTNRHRLTREGEVVPLPPKAIEALIVLVQNPGKPLEREALMQAVWADSFVEDANLTVAISHLRKALGQNGEAAEYIETVPRVGYRFMADVREVFEEPAPLVIEKRTLSRTVIEEEEIPEPAAIAPADSALIHRQLEGRAKRSTVGIAIVAGLLIVAIVAGGVYLWRNTHQPVSTRSLNSLAVLPFKPLGPQPQGEEYLGVGLSDSLITRLSQVKQLAVRPTSAIMRFSDDKTDPLKVGHDLGVEAVLNGRIARDHDRVRVTVELLRVGDGQPMWTQAFDEQFTNLFAVEDTISDKVAQALTNQISGEEREQLKRRGTASSDAFRAFLRGRYELNKRTPAQLRNAIASFKEALDLDPTYAEAYAGLADCYLLLGDYAWAPANDSLPLARAAAQKALEIDDGMAEAHTTLGHIEFDFTHDWSAAEREYQRGIELQPNYATGHHWYALFLTAMGRFNDAEREIKRAEELDPLSLIIKANVGSVYYFSRQYDRAIEVQRKVVATDPNFVQGRRKLAFSLEAKGVESEAINEWLEVERLMGTAPETVAAYQASCAKYGIRGYWLQAVEFEKASDEAGRSASLSSYYARLNQKDDALYWLNKAVEEKTPWLVYAKVSPVYDSLRDDPRFNEVLRKLGL